MTIELTTVTTQEDIAVVAALAQEIWEQHFTPIIGASQVEYMLGKFQSFDAITSQIETGCEYYLAKIKNEAVGYTGLIPENENKRLMLSKIYVKASARQKGVGQFILNFIEHKCVNDDLNKIWLTVNRFNTNPIVWYENRGFVKVNEVKKDIGAGYFMDDFIMEKSISSRQSDNGV
ncbi:MAG: GNAT family N-acetyltransferase [Gammaproteobacteria bacterium]|nr:GNAT family N-acetyltransferase [Gammaproteobacteria bacterium]